MKHGKKEAGEARIGRHVEQPAVGLVESGLPDRDALESQRFHTQACPL